MNADDSVYTDPIFKRYEDLDALQQHQAHNLLWVTGQKIEDYVFMVGKKGRVIGKMYSPKLAKAGDS